MFPNREFIRHLIRASLAGKPLRMRNQRPIVSFTFDDFPISAVKNGARILEDRNARGTFYLSGSYCGQVVSGIPQYCENDLSALVAKGHEIGSHTFHHQRVSTLSAKQLSKEIDLNNAFLARYFPNVTMRTFAYPYGDISFWSTVRLQRRFLGCRCSEPGLNSGTVDFGRLRAIRLYDGLISREDVSDLIQKANAENAWLIFYTHDVDEAPSRFGCNPALFEHAVAAATVAGADVLPVVNAIQAILSGLT